jgi:hypothetical protein
MHVRLATVGPESGTFAVDGSITVTRDGSTPSARVVDPVAFRRRARDPLDGVEHGVAADRRLEPLPGRRGVSRAQREPAPDRERILAAQPRQLVDLALVRERRLRRAEPAERAVRRVVGRDHAAADAHRRAAIRPGRVQHAARQHDRRQRQVRAAVHHAIDVDRE